MNLILTTLDMLSIPYLDRGTNIFIPDLKNAEITISKVNNLTDGSWYTVAAIKRHFVVDNLKDEEAMQLAIFLFFITRMRTMDDEFDVILQRGFNILIDHFITENNIQKEQINKLLSVISEKLLPLVKEVNKK
jgi:hypothetical protein